MNSEFHNRIENGSAHLRFKSCIAKLSFYYKRHFKTIELISTITYICPNTTTNELFLI